MKGQNTYADAGVNIELGDDASKVLYNAARQTWDNRNGKLGELVVPFDDFSGVRAIDVSGLPKRTLMNIGFDGVGTKMELAERVGNHKTIAYDLFAMVCDDAVVRGAEPVLIGSILDVNSLGSGEDTYVDHVRQLAEGYIDAAREANVAIVNGEVAELGDRVGGYGSNSFASMLAHQYISTNMNKENWGSMKKVSEWIVESDPDKQDDLRRYMRKDELHFVTRLKNIRTLNYNWGAAVVWFANGDRLFTGKEIKRGDYLVGLREGGFRSNGLSLVRKIMEKHHGADWHKVPWKVGNETLAGLALTPSRIYTGAVVDMFGGHQSGPRVEVHGIAHITGGGIPGKLGRMLKPSGLGAVIDDSFKPSDFVGYVQGLGNVSDEEAYKTWNMGQGMIIATPNPVDVISIANEYGIEAKNIGYVIKGPDIRIKNKGTFNPFDNPDFVDSALGRKGPEELVFPIG